MQVSGLSDLSGLSAAGRTAKLPASLLVLSDLSDLSDLIYDRGPCDAEADASSTTTGESWTACRPRGTTAIFESHDCTTHHRHSTGGGHRRPKRRSNNRIPHRSCSTGSSAGPSPPSARETSASTAPNPSEIGRARSTRSKFWSSTAGSSPTKRAGATCTNGKLSENR